MTATENGMTRRFTGTPGCSWPGDQAVSVYFDAAQNDEKDLPRSEALLRCHEDPVLFAVPTPLASVVACTHGLWTPRSEQLIRIAEQTPRSLGCSRRGCSHATSERSAARSQRADSSVAGSFRACAA
ncbi:MAG: hypothetical protein ACJ757_07065 [Gaiellaceae bacterium]